MDEVARGDVEAVGLHVESPRVGEREFLFDLFAISDEFEGQGISFEFAFGDFGHLDAITVEFDGSVGCDGDFVDGEDDVAGFEGFIGGAAGHDAGDEESGILSGDIEGFAEGGVEGVDGGDAEVHVAVVGTVLDVFEEAFYDGGGDHVSDVLGDVAAEALEGDADDFAVLEDGAAAIAGVDGGIDLDGEMGIDVGVGVGAEVDTGNDAACDGEAFTADGVTVNADFGFDFWDGAEFEGDGFVEEGFVFEFQDGEVAVVGDVFDGCDVFFGVAFFFEGEEASVGDDVRVGDDALVLSGDDPTGSGSGLGGAGEPWHAVVGLERAIDDAGEAFFDLCGIGGCLGWGESEGEEEAAGEEAADIHGGVGRRCCNGGRFARKTGGEDGGDIGLVSVWALCLLFTGCDGNPTLACSSCDGLGGDDGGGGGSVCSEF